MSLPNIEETQKIVIDAAIKELMPRFTHSAREYKADGSIVTEADRAVQQSIQEALIQRWPEYLFIGEEMTIEEQAVVLNTSRQGVWCLDPVDGTSNFASGVPFFAVSLSLLKDGEVLMGIIYDPIRDECFTAIKDKGSWLNDESLGQRMPKPPLAKGIGLVDLKRLPRELVLRLIDEKPYSSQRNIGSIALEWCWIAAGRGHVYLHGSQRIWDYGAAGLILHEAGGHSMTLEGEPVLSVSLEPRSAVAALNKDLFDEWVAWLIQS
ncbi:Inositol-1-monophosphatase [hydrothermal vent metagenome]|uniref:Inositol-1-monophosphatase n=1 Tax=hydrothermal vent metagenome TaxID=652676 RepID=A0A3B0ZZP4_9ZZZZ